MVAKYFVFLLLVTAAQSNVVKDFDGDDFESPFTFPTVSDEMEKWNQINTADWEIPKFKIEDEPTVDYSSLNNDLSPEYTYTSVDNSYSSYTGFWVIFIIAVAALKIGIYCCYYRRRYLVRSTLVIIAERQPEPTPTSPQPPPQSYDEAVNIDPLPTYDEIMNGKNPPTVPTASKPTTT